MVEDICDRAYMPRGRATGVGDVFDARFRGQRVALKIAAGKSELSGSEIRSRMQNMSLLVER